MHRPSRVCPRREHSAVRRGYADRVGDDLDVRRAGCLRSSLDDGLLCRRHLDLCVRTLRSPRSALFLALPALPVFVNVDIKIYTKCLGWFRNKSYEVYCFYLWGRGRPRGVGWEGIW